MDERSQTTKSGLHCVYDRCQGPPNGPMPECNPGCSFTMSANYPDLSKTTIYAAEVIIEPGSVGIRPLEKPEWMSWKETEDFVRRLMTDPFIGVLIANYLVSVKIEATKK
jgi:hypothetical protein